jgi:hypothetical protein
VVRLRQPTPVHLTLLVLEPTPDGFYEVIIEANGRLVGTCVAGPADDFGGGMFRYVHHCLLSQANRRC